MRKVRRRPSTPLVRCVTFLVAHSMAWPLSSPGHLDSPAPLVVIFSMAQLSLEVSFKLHLQISSVQSLSRVRLFATP